MTPSLGETHVRDVRLRADIQYINESLTHGFVGTVNDDLRLGVRDLGTRGVSREPIRQIREVAIIVIGVRDFFIDDDRPGGIDLDKHLVDFHLTGVVALHTGQGEAEVRLRLLQGCSDEEINEEKKRDIDERRDVEFGLFLVAEGITVGHFLEIKQG